MSEYQASVTADAYDRIAELCGLLCEGNGQFSVIGAIPELAATVADLNAEHPGFDRSDFRDIAVTLARQFEEIHNVTPGDFNA